VDLLGQVAGPHRVVRYGLPIGDTTDLELDEARPVSERVEWVAHCIEC
jgi:hypothetical protein